MLNFHLTVRDFGEKVTLIPQEKGQHRPYQEPEVPRICVAPTISGCLLALGPLFCFDDRVYVYQTNAPTLEPYDVLDSHLTGERWIVQPAFFILRFSFYISEELDDLLAKVEHVGADTRCQEEYAPEITEYVKKYFNCC